LLRQLKLYDSFEVIVVSCEVGFSKPSPIIFEHAAEKLALPPNAILHVGDSVEMDQQGARAAGMQSVLLQRGTRIAEPGQIGSLRELDKAFPHSFSSPESLR
jgi:FMN phosphatase YigB (HAD superfamily)